MISMHGTQARAFGVPRAVEPLAHPPGRALADRVAALEAAVAAWPKPGRGVALIASSGTLESTIAAFNVAIGAASMGEPADVFLAFWGLCALRREQPVAARRSWFERLFAALLPRGARRIPLGRMNFGGAGKRMLERRMASLRIPDLAELIEMAAAAGVRLRVCSTSLETMGLSLDDLIDYPGLEVAGVGSFLALAMERRVTMVF